jgi:elongation factor 3
LNLFDLRQPHLVRTEAKPHDKYSDLSHHPDAKAAADKLAQEISKQGFSSFQLVEKRLVRVDYPIKSFFSNGKVIETMHKFATNKTSGYERESAAMAFQSFAAVLGPPVAPVLLSSLPTLFDLYMDKGEVVRQAATGATKAILKLFPPESSRLVFKTLEGVIENGKWRAKAGALDAMRTFVSGAEEAVATELAAILPPVTAAMHDTKNEVRRTPIIQSNVR